MTRVCVVRKTCENSAWEEGTHALALNVFPFWLSGAGELLTEVIRRGNKNRKYIFKKSNKLYRHLQEVAHFVQDRE